MGYMPEMPLCRRLSPGYSAPPCGHADPYVERIVPREDPRFLVSYWLADPAQTAERVGKCVRCKTQLRPGVLIGVIGPAPIDQVVVYGDTDGLASTAWAGLVGICPYQVARYEALRAARRSMPAAYRQTVAGT
ncbi:hypothetical protein [Actinoplanes palleronii]|uniref:Uncharacterized protein n=1 Tax=Actinoplanes palleronii TaxID=113570 RepID=A0ABQ4B7R1_9ACTN|nr:hypothetical protein [Actinoplanes palleronii]GIE66310.1 hypothetical protein Apa02nite_024180 [Actinoplanes palleronii]